MNPIYNQMNQMNRPNLFQQFMQFKNSFKGNAQQQIQQMLNSGQISQEQYNHAVQQAQALRKMLGM